MSMPILPEESVDNCHFDIYRPFGSSSPHSTGHTGSLIDDLQCGRNGSFSGIIWTNTLYVSAGLDIRDGITRNPFGDALLYSDGDKIIADIPGGSVTYVVVWVDQAYDHGSTHVSAIGSKAVRLMRDSITWDVP